MFLNKIVTFFFRFLVADRAPGGGSFRRTDRKEFRGSTSTPSCRASSTKRPETKSNFNDFIYKNFFKIPKPNVLITLKNFFSKCKSQGIKHGWSR